jgi:hypothetical protein
MGVTVGALYAETNDFLVVYICILFIRTVGLPAMRPAIPHPQGGVVPKALGISLKVTAFDANP